MSAEEAEKFRAVVEANRNVFAEEALARFNAALTRIAALSEGPVVHGGFDEPGSAQIAREALAAEWFGPCVHGRDPWDRCDRCVDAGAEVAWAMAEIARTE